MKVGRRNVRPCQKKTPCTIDTRAAKRLKKVVDLVVSRLILGTYVQPGTYNMHIISKRSAGWKGSLKYFP